MTTAIHSVKPSCLLVGQRSGHLSPCHRLAAFRPALPPPGLQSRRSIHVARAAETNGGSGVDFGALFSDALSGSSATKAPPQQLPEQAAPTESLAPAISDLKLNLSKIFTSPEPASQTPPDAGPSLPQPIQQATEPLTKSGDAASSSVAEPLGGSPMAASAPTIPAEPIPAEPAGSASDAGVSVTESAASVVESAQNAANDVKASVQGTVSDLFGSGSATASSARATADEASAGLRSAADGSLAAAQNTANDLLSSALGARDEATESLAQLTSSLGASASQTSSAAADAAGQAFGQLPQPVQESLSQVASVVSQAASQAATYASENPGGAAAVAVPVFAGGPLAVWLASRLTAYSGNKTPDEVLDVLETSDAVLVDIRSDRDRRRQGLPVLEAGAYGKGAIIPRFALGSGSSMVRNAGELQIDAVAATIAQLSKVRRRRTMVVLLDRGDGTAVPIAKRLLTFGVLNSCVVQGGFRQWAADGLPVDTSSDSDYAVSALQLLGARTTLAANQTATSLRSPVLLAGSIASLALVVGAVLDWHQTLQFVGVAGLLLSVLNRTLSYETPQDLIDDVSIVATTVIGPVASTTRVVGSAVARVVGPSKQGSQQQQRRQSSSTQRQSRGAKSGPTTSRGDIQAVSAEVQDVASEVASGSPLGSNPAARD